MLFHWNHSNVCCSTKHFFPSLYCLCLHHSHSPHFLSLVVCLCHLLLVMTSMSLIHTPAYTGIVLMYSYTAQTYFNIHFTRIFFRHVHVYQAPLIIVNPTTKKIRPSLNHDSRSIIAFLDLLTTSVFTGRLTRRLARTPIEISPGRPSFGNKFNN